MAHCAHLLAFIAIGLVELLFLAAIGGNIYGMTQVDGGKTGFIIGAIVSAVAFLIFNCMLWCYWSKLQVAIAVIDSTADFMVATKRIAFVTIYYFIMSLISVLFWGFGLIGIVSLSEIKAELSENGVGYHKELTFTNKTTGLTIAMVFCIVWILSYIREKTKFVYMISAA
jgi:hypothetical protein